MATIAIEVDALRRHREGLLLTTANQSSVGSDVEETGVVEQVDRVFGTVRARHRVARLEFEKVGVDEQLGILVGEFRGSIPQFAGTRPAIVRVEDETRQRARSRFGFET